MRFDRQGTANVPSQLFASTHAQRVALARRQFFEEGVRPSGLVAEAVLQSWMRCGRRHAEAHRAVRIESVTPSRLHATLGRNRQLIDAAHPELSMMESALAGTGCRVILTDRFGIVLHVTQYHASVQQPVLRQTSRVGINVSEQAIGTSAPGIVAATGQACTVYGAEHYFDALSQMQCAAAPIRDVHGRLAGVLDLTTEGRHFTFDAASLVALHARTIENRLLQAQSCDHLILRFQASPALLGTPLEALAGIADDGTVAWINDVGRQLVGCLPGDPVACGVEFLFGHDLASLLQLGRRSIAQATRLGNGLGVWMQAHPTASDGIDFRRAVSLCSDVSAAEMVDRAGAVAAVAEPSPELPAAQQGATDSVGTAGTLREHNRKLIEDTIAACDGNMSKAAKLLRVSRGTLYRRLRDWELPVAEELAEPR